MVKVFVSDYSDLNYLVTDAGLSLYTSSNDEVLSGVTTTTEAPTTTTEAPTTTTAAPAVTSIPSSEIDRGTGTRGMLDNYTLQDYISPPRWTEIS